MEFFIMKLNSLLKFMKEKNKIMLIPLLIFIFIIICFIFFISYIQKPFSKAALEFDKFTQIQFDNFNQINLHIRQINNRQKIYIEDVGLIKEIFKIINNSKIDNSKPAGLFDISIAVTFLFDNKSYFFDIFRNFTDKTIYIYYRQKEVIVTKGPMEIFGSVALTGNDSNDFLLKINDMFKKD